MKRKRLRRTVIILFIVVIMAVVPGVYVALKTQVIMDSNSNLFELMAVFAEMAGALGLIYEFDNNKKIEEADFIININQKYLEDPDYQRLLRWLEAKGYESCDKEELVIYEDIAIKILDFFDPFYILLNKGIIDIDVLNDLFGFRFFAVTNNKWIQDNIINDDDVDNNFEFYHNIANLHFLWESFRRKSKGEIPFEDTSMSRAEWYRKILNKQNGKSYDKAHGPSKGGTG